MQRQGLNKISKGILTKLRKLANNNVSAVSSLCVPLTPLEYESLTPKFKKTVKAEFDKKGYVVSFAFFGGSVVWVHSKYPMPACDWY